MQQCALISFTTANKQTNDGKATDLIQEVTTFFRRLDSKPNQSLIIRVVGFTLQICLTSANYCKNVVIPGTCVFHYLPRNQLLGSIVFSVHNIMHVRVWE